MSEKVARLAVTTLRNSMFPLLPQQIRDMFPKILDPLVDQTEKVPNIVVGQYQDFGANAGLPMIAVNCEGASEGIVNVYRHITMHVDIWVGANQSPNVDARRIASIIYEYVFRSLQNVNWSSKLVDGISAVQIERCYELERSAILFEPTNKIYHIANSYRVEALSQTWY